MNGRDRQALHALLDGALSPEEAAALRARAAREPALGSQLAALERTQQALRGLRAVEAGPRPFVVPTRAPARSWGWLWSALPLAAAAVLGFAWWSGRSPLEIEAPGIAVELRLTAPEASEVQVAGDFNDWKPEPLARHGDAWATRLRLLPGRYAYMYVVDGRWTPDPQAHSFRDDEFGRQNAVLHL